MNKGSFALIVFIVGAALSCASAGEVDPRDAARRASERNQTAVFRHLLPALRSVGGVGRLYYRAACWTDRGDGILFPPLHAKLPATNDSGTAAVRAVLRGDKQVGV